MEIELLADHQHFIPEVAKVLFHEFGYLIPQRTLKDFEERTLNHCNKKSLPITFIALENGKLIGTFSLRAYDMETHKHFSPWIGSVVVHPSRRREGIGSALVQKAKAICKEQGHKTLFLFTPNKQAWYRKLGWEVVEETTFYYHSATIMNILL